MSQFEPAELYTSEGYILNLIVQGAQSEIAERYIALDDLLIKRIILPQKIADAIESKLIQEQRLFEYTFLIAQAEQEAKRQAIEGGGILKFQQEVASGGSFRDYLRYAGIQATVDLARSNNAKMVMVGNSEGLPVILNMPDDGNRAGGTPNPALPPRGTSTPSPLNLPRTDPTAPRSVSPDTSAPPTSSPETSAAPSSTPETSAPPVTTPPNSSATSAPVHETAPTTPPPTRMPDTPPSNPGTKPGKP